MAVRCCILFNLIAYRVLHIACNQDKLSWEDKAQAEVVVGVARGVVVPVRHTAVSGVVVPAATTVDAVRACFMDTVLRLLIYGVGSYGCQPC